MQTLAVTHDDEQRVVDADAEPDHDRDGRRVVGHGEHAADECGQSDAGADAGDGDGERQTHRQHRSERQDQDHDREGEPDELGLGGLELTERGTAGQDAQTVDGRSVIGDRSTDLGCLGVVDVFGQEDLRERELSGEWAFAGDLPAAVGYVWRQDGRPGMLGHTGVVREAGVDEREELGHRSHDAGIVDALLGGEDDAARLSAGAERREMLLQDGETVGAVGVRNVERLLVGRADRTDSDEDADECGQPQPECAEAVIETPRPEPAERCRTAGAGP